MPTRRILEMTILAVVAVRPVFGMVRLWSHKAVATTRPGSISHGAAEIGLVLA